MISIIAKKTTRIFSTVLFCCFIISGLAQQATVSGYSMGQRFYVLNHKHLYWFSSNNSIKKANDWLTRIESARNLGLVTDTLRTSILHRLLFNSTLDSMAKRSTDRQITDVVLEFLKTLQQGNIKFEYDEVSVSRDSVYVYQLFNAKPGESVSKTVARLDCKDHDYTILKKHLQGLLLAKDTLKYKKVMLAMNYRRYLSLNHQSEYIIVNIPAAEAYYYKKDKLIIQMRTVVGKKSKPTPVFASYITSITTFPYWNVPHSIAVKELLPKIQKDDNYLEQNNFDVVDAKGNVIDDSDLKWSDYTEENFPYFFRQSTGAGNALGVLKFNLRNPFSIFLHATSRESVFANTSRFLSHGCIRMEKPFALADALLRGKLNIAGLKKEKKDTQSSTINLPHKVPTFIIYMPVMVVGNNLTFFEDVYGVIK